MAMALQHPLHKHVLTRRETMRNRRSFKCDICSQEVCDAAYICEDDYCSYTLHEACALMEFPLEIANHPIHPRHPLVFVGDTYRCDICKIKHDAPIVIASPTPLEEEGTIQSVYHDHPLTAFHVKVPNWIGCGACRERIPGPAFGCQTCYFFLHESCARLPREILQHPSHPEHPLTPVLSSSRRKEWCHVCGYQADPGGLAYGCGDCAIWIHVACVTLILSLQDQEKEDRLAINHLAHEHQLLSGLVEESLPTNLRCATCYQKILGEVYYCLGCIFFLHKQCADELPHDMSHYLHPEHRLVLLPKHAHNEENPKCGCCGMPYSGLSFHCASCEFYLDSECAVRTSSAVRDGISTQIQYFGHDDPLVLCYTVSGNNSCKACNLEISGLAYTCIKTHCPYTVHKSCAEIPSQLEHPLHSHPLNLVPKLCNCHNCSSAFSRGFCTFNCPDCAFNLCIKCAIGRPTQKHQLHEHVLGYHQNTDENIILCNSCGNNDTSDFYCCRRCNFNIHRSCAVLPPTIQYEHHPYHPLVLFDRFVEGLPEYQYCDYCEELRDPDHGVYRCALEECLYTVHIGCVLPQATQPEKLYLDKLSKKIASLGETIEAKEKDLAALKQKREELEEERRKILSKHGEEV